MSDHELLTTFSDKRRAPAFSLIELLISIMVIAVLAALLIPALKRASEKSRQAKCATQLRQLFLGMNYYMADNQFFFPPAVGTNSASSNWFWYRWDSPLASYLGGANTLASLSICPNNRTSQVIAATSGMNGYPYTVNYNILSGNTVSYPVIKSVSLQNPSSIVLMIDGAADTGWGLGFDLIATNNATWLARSAERHQERANILWCDGHVSSQPRSELTPQNSYNKSYR